MDQARIDLADVGELEMDLRVEGNVNTFLSMVLSAAELPRPVRKALQPSQRQQVRLQTITQEATKCLR